MHEALPWTRPPTDPSAPGVIIPSKKEIDEMDGSPTRIRQGNLEQETYE